MAEKKKDNMREITVKDKSTIAYSGKVSVQVVRNGKVVNTYTKHNAAGDALFKYLIYCLAGHFAQDLVPAYVVPAYTDSGDNTTKYVGNTVQDIAYMGAHVDTSPYYVEYKFYLPYQSQYTSPGFNTLVLYNSSLQLGEVIDSLNIDQNYSAIVNLEQNVTANPGENLILSWQLQILDVNDETSAE